jgi:hypothetical protein
MMRYILERTVSQRINTVTISTHHQEEGPLKGLMNKQVNQLYHVSLHDMKDSL